MHKGKGKNTSKGGEKQQPRPPAQQRLLVQRALQAGWKGAGGPVWDRFIPNFEGAGGIASVDGRGGNAEPWVRHPPRYAADASLKSGARGPARKSSPLLFVNSMAGSRGAFEAEVRVGDNPHPRLLTAGQRAEGRLAEAAAAKRQRRRAKERRHREMGYLIGGGSSSSSSSSSSSPAAGAGVGGAGATASGAARRRRQQWRQKRGGGNGGGNGGRVAVAAGAAAPLLPSHYSVGERRSRLAAAGAAARNRTVCGVARHLGPSRLGRSRLRRAAPNDRPACLCYTEAPVRLAADSGREATAGERGQRRTLSLSHSLSAASPLGGGGGGGGGGAGAARGGLRTVAPTVLWEADAVNWGNEGVYAERRHAAEAELRRITGPLPAGGGSGGTRSAVTGDPVQVWYDASVLCGVLAG